MLEEQATMSDSSSLIVESFFDEATSIFSHIVLDTATMHCALVDTVLDFDPKSGRTSTTSADCLVARVLEIGASAQWLLETHVHADHLSAAPYLQRRLGGKIGIGSRIVQVQETFGKLFNAGAEFQRDGSQFDSLFEDGDSFDNVRAGRFLPAEDNGVRCLKIPVDAL